jgi:DNA-binding NarL/FixJ family response regulator
MCFTDAVSVVISDANQMGCQLLAGALRNSGSRFDVVASAVDSHHIVEAAKEYEPHVALISLNLKDGPLAGLGALRALRTSCPSVCSVMLLGEDDRDVVVDCFRGGAKGVFCRTAPFEALCKCIEKIHEGQIWASSDELQVIIEAFANTAPLRNVNPKLETQLTKREDQIVDLACQGLSNRQISGQLNVSSHTVKNHLFRIYEKLGVSSRVELVLHSRRSSTF